MTTTLLLDNLAEEEEDNVDISDYKLDPESLTKTILDLCLPISVRVKALDMQYTQDGSDSTVDIINKLCTMYEISGTSILRKYLYEICMKSVIDPFQKSICAKTLLESENDDDKKNRAYDAMCMVYPHLDMNVGTPYKADILRLLMHSKNHQEKTRDFFRNIISDHLLNCDFRYKLITSLDKGIMAPEPIDKVVDKVEPDEKNEKKSEPVSPYKFFILDACNVFIRDVKNDIKYRILAGQRLLKEGVGGEVIGSNSGDNLTTTIESILLDIAKDSTIEYNYRADAADVVLSLGSSLGKANAREIITHLGTSGKKVMVYDNKQNVHSQMVEESVNQALRFLSTINNKKVEGKEITIDYVFAEIEKMLLNYDQNIVDKVRVAMDRIVLDRMLYGTYNLTLTAILTKVWTYMCGHDHEEEMRKRLIEEMCEAAGTCSSGYASRIINTISGFGDFTIGISWGDQIVANFTGRLNALIRNMDDLRLQEKILAQITLESSHFEDRKHFLKFLRENMLAIREEMHLEFREHMSDTDFDLYFRSAISMYDAGF